MRTKHKLLLGAAFLCFFVCISIGYATLTTDLGINGIINANTQQNVFIIDVSESEDFSGETPCEYYGTLMQNVVIPEGKNEAVYYVKLYNNNTKYQYYHYGVFSDKDGTTSLPAGGNASITIERLDTEEKYQPLQKYDIIEPRDGEKDNTMIVKVTVKRNDTSASNQLKVNGINIVFASKESTFDVGNCTLENTAWWKAEKYTKTQIEKLFIRRTCEKVVYDSTAKTITYFAENDESGTGSQTINVKEAWRVGGSDEHPTYAFIQDADHIYLGIIGGNERGELFAVEDMSYAFAGFTGLEKTTSWSMHNFWRLDTTYCTTMKGMFQNCNSMANADISFNNTSNVTDMSYMFAGCTNMQLFNVSNFNTSNVTNFSHMFDGCKSLIHSYDYSNTYASAWMYNYVDLGHFDISKGADLSYMFYGCEAIERVDLSLGPKKTLTNRTHESFYVKEYESTEDRNMTYMFAKCSVLYSIDMRGIDMGKADITGMFANRASGKDPVYIYSAESDWTKATSKDDETYNKFSFLPSGYPAGNEWWGGQPLETN